jgi:3-hydroxyisobutyrate dehydrogenase-like beta-hydroxyacid dehydrogenase
MALNILKAGFEVTAFDIRAEAMEWLKNQGAKTARSPAEIAGKVDMVLLCLPDAAVVEKVIFGEYGVVQSAMRRLILVDCGTTAYIPTLDFARRLKRQGIRFADAPVTGMEARARDATLTVMFGGDRSLFKRVHPVLQAMGKRVIYMGHVGTGQLTKLVNQLLFNVNIAAIAEILPMAVKLGLDPEKVSQVVTTGTGQSFAADFFVPLILEGRFDPGYALRNAYKDMISASELSVHQSIPLPLVHAATTTYQWALAQGYGHENKAAMIKVFEHILGVEFRKKGQGG